MDCKHGWTDEDGCPDHCDGTAEIAGYCRVHARLVADPTFVEEIESLRAELAEAKAAHEFRIRNLSINIIEPIQARAEQAERERDEAIDNLSLSIEHVEHMTSKNDKLKAALEAADRLADVAINGEDLSHEVRAYREARAATTESASTPPTDNDS